MNFSPNEINKTNENYIYENWYKKRYEKSISKIRRAKLKINQAVRVVIPREAFTRIFHNRWSVEVYFIHAINRKHLVYKIRDQSGKVLKKTFYEAQLKPTKYEQYSLIEQVKRIERKKNRALVKYYHDPKYYYVNLSDLNKPI